MAVIIISIKVGMLLLTLIWDMSELEIIFDGFLSTLMHLPFSCCEPSAERGKNRQILQAYLPIKITEIQSKYRRA